MRSFSPSIPTASSTATSEALQRLVNREEVLQICFWYQGEGFGKTFTANALVPFLSNPAAAIDVALAELVAHGLMRKTPAGYAFTAEGRREGGRLFRDGFAEFQRPAHGDCEAGCCDGDDHSRCGDDCALH